MIKELIITYLPGLNIKDFEEICEAVREERQHRDHIRSQSMPTPKFDRELSQVDNIRMYRDKYNCSMSLAFTIVRKHW